MNKLIGSLVIGLFSSASMCNADMAGHSAAAIDLAPIIVRKQDLQELPKPVAETNQQKVLKPEIKVPPKKAAWKKEIERWAMEEQTVPASSSLTEKIEPQKPYEGFLSSVSPRYNVNKNFLSLTKVSTKKPRDAFMFVFMMNNPHNKYKGQTREDYQRVRMHILWTGSKKMMVEQKFIKNEYPVDVSIANYEDGYAEGEWNLVLPNKKPREVKVSLLWSF